MRACTSEIENIEKSIYLIQSLEKRYHGNHRITIKDVLHAILIPNFMRLATQVTSNFNKFQLLILFIIKYSYSSPVLCITSTLLDRPGTIAFHFRYPDKELKRKTKFEVSNCLVG